MDGTGHFGQTIPDDRDELHGYTALDGLVAWADP
jgi:hypothetical protein